MLSKLLLENAIEKSALGKRKYLWSTSKRSERPLVNAHVQATAQPVGAASLVQPAGTWQIVVDAAVGAAVDEQSVDCRTVGVAGRDV